VEDDAVCPLLQPYFTERLRATIGERAPISPARGTLECLRPEFFTIRVKRLITPQEIRGLVTTFYENQGLAIEIEEDGFGGTVWLDRVSCKYVTLTTISDEARGMSTITVQINA
jgi:hypothetical protein